MDSSSVILVVPGDEPGDAGPVLSKAAALARAAGARLHAVRVVFEGVADLSAAAIDASIDLKSAILAAEETVTEDFAEPWRTSGVVLDTATLWNPRHWEGVLHAAQDCGAELIVKSASRHPRFGHTVRTPDDWNLLRHAAMPVLLCRPRAWTETPSVLCALDVFDRNHDALSVQLLQQAQSMSQRLGGEFSVVVAYPLFERWVG